jgi:SAM-dependent methyltransferase
MNTNVKKRTCCRACGSKNIEVALDLGMMPLAGGFLADQAALKKEQKFPLPIYVCNDCSLVQICDIIDPEILFQDYSFSSSTIAPLVDHFTKYAQWLNAKFQPKVVVEFGCNDGILLKPLQELGIKACGVDVSRNITDLAQSKGLDAVAGYFNVETASAIRERIGAADIVTGSNAFAHNDEPEKILEAAKTVLQPKGVLCIEAMYAGDMLETYQWDTLYHEHLTFYSLTTLEKLLNNHGFYLVEAERIPMHGGSIRVAASLDKNAKRGDSVERVMAYEREKGLGLASTWKQFGSFVGRKIDVVREVFDKIHPTSRVWGYGAAGKATMWVNACKMDYLERMVDASPLRAGKMMPGTHTPIVFPEDLKQNPPDYIFVTAWNYAEGIRAKESWYKGIWVTPLPEMRFF